MFKILFPVFSSIPIFAIVPLFVFSLFKVKKVNWPSAPIKFSIFTFNSTDSKSISPLKILLNWSNSIDSGPNVIVSLPRYPFAYSGIILNSV